ncbi:MAG: hypothetical protein ABFD18_06630 [Syntrophomonas sp.]
MTSIFTDIHYRLEKAKKMAGRVLPGSITSLLLKNRKIKGV